MIRTVIVDDEPKNREILKKLIDLYCPQLAIIGEANSAETAFLLIQEEKPELVFLDVEMSDGSGFELLKRFNQAPFKVIFVTAHQHYAIRAIKQSAIDYLLKPVDIDDLKTAVSKAVSALGNATEQNHNFIENLNSKRLNKITIPIKDGLVFINPEEIIRMQADGTYTHIYTLKEKHTATKNIKEYELMLSDSNFYRCHNSHLINLKHVNKFNRSEGYFIEMTDGSIAELSRRKKDEFISLMSKYKA